MELAGLLNVPENLHFEPEEWENIPPVVSATLQMLQREVVGLTKILKNGFQADQIIESKFNSMEEIEFIKMKIAKNTAEVAKAVGEMRTLENAQEEIWNKQDKFVRESEKMMKYIKQAKALPKQEDHIQELTSMWSISGIKKLISDTINESDIKKLLEAREYDIMHIDDQICQIIKMNEKLIDTFSTETTTIHEKVKKFEKSQDDLIEQTRKDQQKIQQEIANALADSIKTKQLMTETKLYNELLLKRQEDNKLDFENKIKETNEKILHSIKRIKKRKSAIGDLVKTQNETMEKITQITGRIDEQDKILEVFKQLLDQQEKLKRLEESMSQSKQELKALVTETMENIKNDMKDTKREVYNKLEETDSEMKTVLQKMDTVTESLEQWALKVIKPAQSNEAKIYTFETRLREEESLRIRDVCTSREQIKKIIYALEQYSIAKVDKENGEIFEEGIHSDHSRSDDEQNQTQLMLPSVDNKNSFKTAKGNLDTSLVVGTSNVKLRRKHASKLHKQFKGPEFLLMKRLHYIKMILEGQIDGSMPEVIHYASKTGTNFQKIDEEPHVKHKRKLLLNNDGPNLLVEAKKMVSVGVDQDTMNKSSGFDYKIERKKHKTFKNYVASMQTPNEP